MYLLTPSLYDLCNRTINTHHIEVTKTKRRTRVLPEREEPVLPKREEPNPRRHTHIHCIQSRGTFEFLDQYPVVHEEETVDEVVEPRCILILNTKFLLM